MFATANPSFHLRQGYDVTSWRIRRESTEVSEKWRSTSLHQGYSESFREQAAAAGEGMTKHK